jgi:hypothetical protein
MFNDNKKPLTPAFASSAARWGIVTSLTNEFAKTNPRPEFVPVRLAYNMNLVA